MVGIEEKVNMEKKGRSVKPRVVDYECEKNILRKSHAAANVKF